ncbi:MAG TPA: thymidine phosphorylase, partial [bacterium]|nr:thymidine phosphorylase [bacterium]
MKSFYDIIAAKRDGKILSEKEISHFLGSYLEGSLKDYQMAAMLMAVFINKLNEDELKSWVENMLHSGDILDFSDIEAPVVDKHSTGGVGDKISIPLAPLLAVLGFHVPMISGRGLGHTGGTLDKLESIPGFSVNLSIEKFKKMVRENGLSLIGQTPEIAPLDKKLYALRDVTGTVESIPLIASSIMSKKMAEGIRGLILDVKVGKGAFMKNINMAEELAETMKNIGENLGVKVNVLFTDMNEPLGYCVGNSLEIIESVRVLRGEQIPQVTELVIEMAATLMLSFNLTDSLDEGRKKAAEKLKNGSAFDKFKEIVELQGGDPTAIDNTEKLPLCKKRIGIKAEKHGIIKEINALSFGKALVSLGGGRVTKEDTIDPGTGCFFHKKIGEKVNPGDIIYDIYY